MNFQKPAVNTKVRITVDNSVFAKSAIAYQPKTVVIEGTVFYSNEWDEPNSLRLLCINHTIKHPVIPLSLILQLETFNNIDNESIDLSLPQQTGPNEMVFRIESSRTGEFYKVTKKDDKFFCNCIAGLHGKSCRHIAAARKEAAKLDTQDM
jgi:hypothetical protein